MSEIGNIDQLSVTHAHPLVLATRSHATIQMISLAEHERTMGEVVRERDRLLRERVHAAAVLAAFRDAKLSISSVQPILDLADALCGPKEMVCPPHS